MSIFYLNMMMFCEY